MLCATVKGAIQSGFRDVNCKEKGIFMVVYDGQNYYPVPGEVRPSNTEIILTLIKSAKATCGWKPVIEKRK